jgi:hypothetical protein
MTIFCTEPVPQPVIERFAHKADTHGLIGDFRNLHQAIDWLNAQGVIEMAFERRDVSVGGHTCDWAAIRLPGRCMAYARLLS